MPNKPIGAAGDCIPGKLMPITVTINPPKTINPIPTKLKIAKKFAHFEAYKRKSFDDVETLKSVCVIFSSCVSIFFCVKYRK